jgi:hypothetical protein
MDIETFRSFFMWCSVLNGALLVISFLVCVTAGDWIYRMHSKWFPMPRESFNVVIYSFMGLYKILFFALSLVPYIALVMMG